MLSKQFGASSKKLLQTTVLQTTKRLASTSSSSEPSPSNVDHDFKQFRTAIPGNPFNEYIKRYGDRPQTLQKLQVKAAKSRNYGLILFFLPLALGYLYLDYKINQIIETGHYEPLEDFEHHRKERRSKLAGQKKDEEELAKLEAEIYGTAKEHKSDNAVVEPFVMEYNGAQVLVVPPGAKVPANNNKKVVYVASAAQAPEQSKANVSATKNEAEPRQFKYVLIGGGTSSYYAMETIKKNDPNAEILLITEESYAPYSRPPLSKELWRSKDPNVSETLKYTDWSGKDRRPEYKPAEAYAKLKVVLKSKSKVVKLNPADQTIVTDDGQVYKYDKCLLATGGSPIIIPGMETLQDEVLTFRKIDDFKKLDKFSKEEGKNVVIVGGSFLGTELAYSLAANRKLNVTQIYLEPEVLARNVPRYLTKEVSALLSKTGVQLKPNRQVASVYKRNDGKVGIRLDGGEEIAADYVLSAIGIYPNTELAETAGLEIDPVKGGIMTNAELEARNNIFVAGDVLSYYDGLLGRRRLEHYEHAVSTGKTAANNMSSNKRAPYNHISMFWSDIGPISFEAVGDINSSLATYSVWDAVDVLQNGAPWYDAPAPIQNKGFNRGVVYYLKDSKVVGVLLWNVKGKVEEARKVIAENKKISDVSELRDKIKIPASKQ